jgi:hypothetical protein
MMGTSASVDARGYPFLNALLSCISYRQRIYTGLKYIAGKNIGFTTHYDSGYSQFE